MFRCFRDFFLKAGVFLDLKVFVKSVNFLFKALDTFILSLLLLLFSWRMIVLAGSFLWEKTGFMVFPNFLVSVIQLGFKLLKYCCFAFLRTFVKLFLCFLQFWKFTLVRDLLDLLCNFDLIIISFLSLFVVKELLLYLISCLYGENFKMISWVVRSSFLVFYQKILDQNIYSNNKR